MKSRYSIHYLLIILLASSLVSTPHLAFACPTVGGFVNFNCDLDFENNVLFVGDSITKGIGDPETNDRNGGFPKDLEEIFPESRMLNLGVPGITSDDLLRDFKKGLNAQNPIIAKRTQNIDIVQIDVGINDYWRGTPPGRVVRNQKRLRKFIIKYSEEKFGYAPFVYLATLTKTKRPFQNPFVEDVNETMLRYAGKLVKVRFDQLPKKIISKDAIHPSKRGYEKMASLVAEYFVGDLQSELLSKRPDTDGDGIYDLFEQETFGTQPGNPDSDGDAISDGDEVFIHGTNPLSVDTDKDGISDADELFEGTDPKTPESSL